MEMQETSSNLEPISDSVRPLSQYSTPGLQPHLIPSAPSLPSSWPLPWWWFSSNHAAPLPQQPYEQQQPQVVLSIDSMVVPHVHCENKVR